MPVHGSCKNGVPRLSQSEVRRVEMVARVHLTHAARCSRRERRGFIQGNRAGLRQLKSRTDSRCRKSGWAGVGACGKSAPMRTE